MTELLSRLPPDIAALVREGGFVVLVLVLTGLALRLVGRLVRWLAVKLQAPPLSLRPLTVVGRALVLVVLVSTLADHYFAVDFFAMMGGLLALIGIGFVAVWSVLSNVLCTLLLLTVRPFRIGDELELPPDPFRGRVIDLNLFFTTLQAADGRLVQIPNNLFFQRGLLRRRAEVGVSLGEQFSRPTEAVLAEAGAVGSPQEGVGRGPGGFPPGFGFPATGQHGEGRCDVGRDGVLASPSRPRILDDVELRGSPCD
ncbi:MAG: mechanosensitive ion channel [Opitutaceae bacterium]|nr:mechanosensitive ion channel [Opitutaceae bacterium]